MISIGFKLAIFRKILRVFLKKLNLSTDKVVETWLGSWGLGGAMAGTPKSFFHPQD